MGESRSCVLSAHNSTCFVICQCSTLRLNNIGGESAMVWAVDRDLFFRCLSIPFSGEKSCTTIGALCQAGTRDFSGGNSTFCIVLSFSRTTCLGATKSPFDCAQGRRRTAGPCERQRPNGPGNTATYQLGNCVAFGDETLLGGLLGRLLGHYLAIT